MAAILFHGFTIDDAAFPVWVSTTKHETGLGVEAQRVVVRRYLVSHHGEQIAEFVEVESGKRSDLPQLAAAKAWPRGAQAGSES
jgi:hypothetical protein